MCSLVCPSKIDLRGQFVEAQEAIQLEQEAIQLEQEAIRLEQEKEEVGA